MQVLRSQHHLRAAIINSGSVEATDNFSWPDAKESEQEVYIRLVPHYATQKNRLLYLRSPARWPEKISAHTPLLILQGSADWRVTAGPAIGFVQQPYARRQPVRFVLFEGEVHSLRFELLRHQLRYDWLDRYLRDRAPLPDLTLHGE